jgi:hypothetical protein
MVLVKGMAALSAAKRVARLGWWLGLSLGAMVIAACGAMFAGACKSSAPAIRDAGVDTARGQPDGPSITITPPDAATPEAGAATDAGSSDLWNTICE